MNTRLDLRGRNDITLRLGPDYKRSTLSSSLVIHSLIRFYSFKLQIYTLTIDMLSPILKMPKTPRFHAKLSPFRKPKHHAM